MSSQYVGEIYNRKFELFRKKLFLPKSISEYNHIHSIKHSSEPRRVRASVHSSEWARLVNARVSGDV